MKMIFAMRDEHNKPHVYRIDTAVSQEAVECLPTEWDTADERIWLARAILRWFGTISWGSVIEQMLNHDGWTISDDFRRWNAPDLVTPVAESGDWQGADTTRHPDEPEGRDIIDNEGTNK